jgi:transcriptional regulator with XRE-family HTH domain
MTSTPLTNYLVSHRKRLALSQDEVAFLLGMHGGAKVCRYEKLDRVPSLETALAYEAIFERPIRELFAGLYEKVEQEVAERAKVLTYKKHLQRPNPRSEHRRRVLTQLAAKKSQKS